MPGLKRLALAPVRLALGPLKRRLERLIDARLEPLRGELQTIRTDLRTIDGKLDRFLDLSAAPEVLRDFRAHNQTLRAIQADCDLIREMNPMFQSALRDLMRLQLQCEDLAWRLDRASGDEPSERAVA